MLTDTFPFAGARCERIADVGDREAPPAAVNPGNLCAATASNGGANGTAIVAVTGKFTNDVHQNNRCVRGATARVRRCLRSRQANRSADRTYRLHGRAARYRCRPAGIAEEHQQGRSRFRHQHGARPQGGERQSAGAGKKAWCHTGRQRHQQSARPNRRPTSARELAKLSGAAFDKAYIDNEVAYHKVVNGALENTLIPAASNPELKDLLKTGLKIFQGHEQHAEHVAAEFK